MKEAAKEKYILFSPVSGFDPISTKDATDGPMLHICRKYKPEKIMLYLTDEMHKNHIKDDRYRDAINRLYENENFTPDIDPRKSKVKEAHLFEEFFLEFKDLLNEFHNSNSDYKMILNISSGTPQMKANLYMLASFLPFPVLLVQTETPIKGQNHNQNKEYDLDELWELNHENTSQKYEDRAKPVTNQNLNVEIQKKNIGTLLDSYDYDAALKLAQNEEFKELFDSKAIELLKAARDRSQLNSKKITKDIKILFGIDTDNKNLSKITEYLLWLKMKYDRKDYGDYLRAITPIIFKLMQLAVDIKSKYYLFENICSDDEARIDRDALKDNGYGRRLMNFWNIKKKLKSNNEFIGSYLMSDHYDLIIENDFKDKKWAEPLQILRDVERVIRNPLAHTITPISKSWINNRLSADKTLNKDKIKITKNSKVIEKNGIKTIEDVQDILMEAVERLNEDKTNFEASELNVNWGAYDEMNNEIKKAFGIPITPPQNS